jgi:hypothetical protein
MLSTQTKSTAKTVSIALFELISLGILGFMFNRLCNYAYADLMGEKAELPMRIGFVLTYFAIVIPPTIKFVEWIVPILVAQGY